MSERNYGISYSDNYLLMLLSDDDVTTQSERDALKEWKCDVEGALERFLDDEELYLQCLNIFSTDENFAKLKEYIEKCRKMS